MPARPGSGRQARSARVEPARWLSQPVTPSIGPLCNREHLIGTDALRLSLGRVALMTGALWLAALLALWHLGRVALAVKKSYFFTGFFAVHR